MNALDFIVLAAMIAAAYFGYRLGFIARVVSWAGLAIGIVVAVAFVDDVTGLLYRGTQMTEALSEVKGKGTYRVTRDGEAAREERIEPRVLPGAA